MSTSSQDNVGKSRVRWLGHLPPRPEELDPVNEESTELLLTRDAFNARELPLLSPSKKSAPPACREA